MTRWGTSHFVTRRAAEHYYASQCYEDAAEAVRQKLSDGEIHIGPPKPQKPGDTVRLNSEGRYEIEEGK